MPVWSFIFLLLACSGCTTSGLHIPDRKSAARGPKAAVRPGPGSASGQGVGADDDDDDDARGALPADFRAVKLAKYDFRQVYQNQNIPFLNGRDVEIQMDPSCTPTHVVCQSNTSFMQDHFPHAAEKLLPCWSLFQMYPALKRVLVTSKGENPYKHSPWSSHLLEFMQVECRAGAPEATCSVTGHLPRDGGGWNLESGAGEDLTNRFLMRTADAVRLQLAAGLNTAIAGQSGRLRIGILNRAHTRRWTEASAFILAAQKVFPNAIVEEKYFEHEDPVHQAKWTNTQDIIVSPHGAHLTNLIWARRCTGVMELFPQSYFIPGFFGALASVIGGVSFSGYPAGRNAADDTRPVLTNGSLRGRARSAPITADSESVASFLRQVVAQQRRCASAQ